METKWLDDFVRRMLEPIFEGKSGIKYYRLNPNLDKYRLSKVRDNI